MNDDGLPSRALDNINNNNTNNNNNNDFEKKPLQSINTFCYTLIQQLFWRPFGWQNVPWGPISVAYDTRWVFHVSSEKEKIKIRAGVFLHSVKPDGHGSPTGWSALRGPLFR